MAFWSTPVLPQTHLDTSREHLYEPLPGDQFHLEADDQNKESLQDLKPLDVDFLINSKAAGSFQACVPILHMAAKEGRVFEMKRVLSSFPESVMERQSPSDETPLHVAVRHGRHKAIKFLVDWLRKSPYFSDVVNRKDSGGDTVLHLATSRKQLHTLKLLLDNTPAPDGCTGTVEVNTKNNQGLTALDFLHILPEGGKIDAEIEKVLRRAGARRGRDLPKQDQEDQDDEVVINLGCRFHNPSGATTSDSSIIACYATLLLATFFAALTYHAALRRPVGVQSGLLLNMSSRVQDGEPAINYQYHLFVLFNSVAYFTSVGIILILMQDLHLFPWLQVSVSSSVASYVFAVMCNSAQEVTTVLLVGTSIMCVATLKCLALDMALINLFKWLFIRFRVHVCSYLCFSNFGLLCPSVFVCHILT